MEDDINLNNKTNLNISTKDIEQYSKIPKDEKKALIDNWNEKPIIKKNGIKAVDVNDIQRLYEKNHPWLKFFAIIGVISLLVIAISAGVFAWIAYNDNTLLSPTNLFCGNVSVNIDKGICPQAAQPVCDVQCNCPEIPTINMTCPAQTINVHCGNQTG